MKILKKIGIGCLALIICFCSCFKFVNAEFLPEPFTLEYGKTYVFVIRTSYLENTGILTCTGQNDELVTYFSDRLDFEYEASSGTVHIDAPLTYLQEKNNFTYYSFIYPLETSDYIYEDNSICYFETSDAVSGFSVYDTIYNLIETYIFGGSIENGSHQDLTATTLSSIICILVFALPFLIIWKVLKVIMG